MNRRTTMFCYKSTHLDAKNATVLYDDNYAQGSLWSRDSTANPLQPCSAPWTQDLECTVCLHDDQDVYAMCRNLTDKVKMVMEAIGNSVNIINSDCPTPPEDAQQWLQAGIPGIIWTLLFLLLIIIIGVLVYCKCCKNRNEIQNNPQEVMEMTVMTAEADEENHTPPLQMNGINNGSQRHPGIQQV